MITAIPNHLEKTFLMTAISILICLYWFYNDFYFLTCKLVFKLFKKAHSNVLNLYAVSGLHNTNIINIDKSYTILNKHFISRFIPLLISQVMKFRNHWPDVFVYLIKDHQAII